MKTRQSDYSVYDSDAYDDNPDRKTLWDGRQIFVAQLGKRMDLLLDSDMKNPQEWIERLNDFYDCAYPAINNENLLAELNKAEQLVYSKERGPQQMSSAQKKMRSIMRTIHSLLWKNNIWMPLKPKKDLEKSIYRTR